MQKEGSIKFRCSECDQILRADHESAGIDIKCPSCSVMLTVPAVGSEISSSHKYSSLTDAQLERRVANESDPKKRDAILEELTNRFTDHYIKLLDKSKSGERDILKEVKLWAADFCSMIRAFLTKVIGYLSKEI